MALSKIETKNLIYSKEVISDIITEYLVMKNQFIIITDDQIFEHISKLLNERLNQSNN